jgi:primosomal protein N' (replication factor Y) (superfamily II helicase)
MSDLLLSQDFVAVARVRVDLRINKEFDYGIPSNLSDTVQVGSRVKVPFGNRAILGTVLVRIPSPSSDQTENLKSVLEVVGGAGLLTGELLKLAEWMSEYYLCPLDITLRTIAPSVVQKRNSIRFRATKLDPELEESQADVVPTSPLPLSPQQAEALNRIQIAAQQPSPKPILLFGITGSGKTEVYLQAIDGLLKAGKGAIMLVPEIALTPQTLERLRARFSVHNPSASPLAVLHSGLSQGERFREWQKIRSGEARLVVGARSAVFAPVKNLGIIVVDEEHENTYKQEENPRYHARDVAVMRAHFENCMVVLGSATPSLESFHNAEIGKYEVCRMPNRIDTRKLPTIRVVDMRKEMLRQKGLSIFSEPLKEGIQSRLERAEQVILYLNRRGYASSMICKKCGYVAQCPECSVSLSYHRADQKLKCHMCGHQKPAPKVCPEKDCRDPSIRYAGLGTEKLEEAVSKLFPHARIARMDSDTMLHRNDYERTLLRFKMGKLDILLGTQMIAKGLDFPRVTLVGIIYADVGLHLPDFRSSERTFQQITQVAGRAGRGEVEGEVIVQTFTPQHSAIQFARKQDFEGFYREEMKFRESLDYPPMNFLTKIECSSPQATKAEFVAQHIRKHLYEEVGEKLRILGPSPAPVEKVKSKFRYQLLLRDARAKKVKLALHKVLDNLPRNAEVFVTADVDPLHML